MNKEVKESLSIIFNNNSLDSTLSTMSPHYKAITSLLSYSDNTFLSSSRDSNIKIWNNNNKQNYTADFTLTGHSDWVNAMCFNKSKDLLFSAGNDCTIQIWDLSFLGSGESNPNVFPVHSFTELNTDYITSLEYNNYTTSLFSGGLDSRICVYEFEKESKYKIEVKEENLFNLISGDKSIYSISCNREGSLLVCSAYENNILCFDIRKREEVLRLTRQSGFIRDVKISSQGDLLISAAEKGVCLWDLRMPNKIVKQWGQYQKGMINLCPLSNFQSFYSSDFSGDVYLTNILSDSYSLIGQLKESIYCIGLHDNQKCLLAATDNGVVELVNFYFRKLGLINLIIKLKMI